MEGIQRPHPVKDLNRVTGDRKKKLRMFHAQHKGRGGTEKGFHWVDKVPYGKAPLVKKTDKDGVF